MAPRTFNLRWIACAVLIATSYIASAQFGLAWTRNYANNTSFSKVAIDVNNNVYSLGRQNLTPSDLILVKYSGTGVYVWEYRIPAGGPFDTTVPAGHVVDATGNTYIFYGTGVPGAYRARLDKVSPSGALVWTKLIENAEGSWTNILPGSIALDSAGRICLAYSRGTNSNLTQWRFRRYTSDGVLEGSAVTTGSRANAVADQLLVTSDGTSIWRFGVGGTSPASTIHAYPALPFFVYMPDATFLAYSPLQGGMLFGVGRVSATTMRIYRTFLSTGATTARLYAVPDALDTSLRGVACDSDGRLLAFGNLTNLGSFRYGALWSFKWEDLALYDSTLSSDWISPTAAPDRYGSIIMAGTNDPGSASSARAVNAINLTSISGGHTGSVVSAEIVEHSAANSRGYVAIVGRRRTSSGAPEWGSRGWFDRTTS